VSKISIPVYYLRGCTVKKEKKYLKKCILFIQATEIIKKTFRYYSTLQDHPSRGTNTTNTFFFLKQKIQDSKKEQCKISR